MSVDISQGIFSKKINITFYMIVKIEDGIKLTLIIEMIKKITIALGVALNEFIKK
ncbi:MAG: hypothetical protein IPN70_05230 [Candidatus Moraniibacteriota bacterium]|nr:MAG: hypothetical protein IPN70_05230 [Candidatus Moranbacteria bacterium]